MEGSEIQGPPKDNAVLGHIIHRLFNIVSPPEVSKVPSIKQVSRFTSTVSLVKQQSSSVEGTIV